MLRRFSQGLLAFRKSNLAVLSPGARSPSTPYSLLVAAVVVIVRTNLDEVVFVGLDFFATDLRRGLIGRPFYLQLAMGSTAPPGIRGLNGENKNINAP
jgi:hypothetical protein